MDISKITDEQAYELLQKAQAYAATLPLTDWGNGEPAGEMATAISFGITDGTRPMQLATRYQASIMDKRVLEKALKK